MSGWFDAKTEQEIKLLQGAIGDCYYRMATNSDPKYRNEQMDICEKHLASLEILIEKGLKNQASID